MLIGGMVHHQIHDQPHIAPVHLGQQLFKILHGTEFRHYLVVITYIVAIVVIGRIVDGGQPQSIHAQLFQIIQFADDSLQIPDSVPVAVAEAPGVNLVEYRLFPPFRRDCAL